MGRTKRKRKLRKASLTNYYHRLSDEKIIELMQWLSQNSWENKESSLYPADFLETGRGLVSRKSLKKGDVLVKIPYKVLITAGTVCQSALWKYFDKNIKCNGHEILAIFLVWERHKDKQSFWYPYINTLPSNLSTPLIWSKDPCNLPAFISKEISLVKEGMLESYHNLMQHIALDICPHCDTSFPTIFDKHSFIWAWCVVNTRAVYIPREENTFNITNNLALAPFLDLFNHVPNAKIEAMLIKSDNFYQVKTLAPVAKHQQVFIEYGAHSNLKLLIDYGFTVPNNPNDFIAVSLDEIYEIIKEMSQISVLNLSQKKYLFLKKHDLLKNPCIVQEGLCWKTKSIIFIFTTSIDNIKLLESKVYSSQYSPSELETIDYVGLKLIVKKQACFRAYLGDFGATEDCHTVIEHYLKECIGLLNNCCEVLSGKVNDRDNIGDMGEMEIKKI